MDKQLYLNKYICPTCHMTVDTNLNHCPTCHISFDKNLKYCPNCHRFIEKNNLKTILEIATACEKEKLLKQEKSKREQYLKYGEGSGRIHGAGGEACNYCPNCVGNDDWCPYLD